MGFKNFVTSKILKRKLKNLPEEQRKIIEVLVEKHPDIFEQMSKDIETKKKTGVDENLAMIAVMRKYEPQLRKIASQM